MQLTILIISNVNHAYHLTNSIQSNNMLILLNYHMNLGYNSNMIITTYDFYTRN